MEKLESLGLIRILGYVPLDGDGKPYRAERSGYYHKPNNGYHPPRIYTTEAKAIAQSPVKTARQVFMFVDKEEQETITTGFPQ